ncbi:retinol-binding protein pinta-like [Diabrotica undecimpunctata]|uniref:retinol-binding protein pinta-like n=1 Tax=Diabrotica undecimpunctata TaxID=50387 RepID=UPI003B63FBB5
MSDVKVMDEGVFNTFLVVNRDKIRKHWGKTETELFELLDRLKEWIKTQNFPEMPTDNTLEFFLTNCKYNLDKTKKNLTTYYSIRKEIPEVYRHSNPQSPEMENCWDMGVLCPLPNPVEDLYRLSIVKLNQNCSNFVAWKYFALMLNIYEIRICEDLCLSEIIIVDYKQLLWSHVFKMTPLLLKMATILDKLAKNRIKQIHIIEAPSYVSVLINVMKRFLKKKMVDRIIIHKNIESLYEHVPQELLPSDYGGKEKSLDEIIDLWKEHVKKYQKRFDFLDQVGMETYEKEEWE